MFNPSSHFNKRLLDLNSSVYLNTYRRINWDEVIAALPDGVPITTDPTRWNLDTPGYVVIYGLNQIKYNPRVTPNWTLNDCNCDGFKIKRIASTDNKLFTF